MSKQLPRKTKKLLAEGILISRLQYLITQWGGGVTENYMTAAQRLLNRIARWVTGCNNRTRIASLMTEVGWLSVADMTTLQSLTQMWKIVHLDKPEIIRDIITIEEDLHPTTRAPRLLFTEQGYVWRTIKIWNQLPIQIRELREGFKKKFRKLAFDQLGRTPPLPPSWHSNIEFFLPIFFILVDSIHFKTDFSMIFFLPSLPSVTYYLQSQNCTIPTIF